MRIALINLTSSGANAGAPWATCNSALAVTNMADITGAATTWDFSFTAGNPSYNGFSGGTGYLGGAVGSGDAAWVNNQIVISTGVGVNKLSGWYSTKFAQLDTSKQYKIDIFGSINATTRNLEARVNGGVSQSIPCYNNSTVTMTFDNLQPNGSGELLLELRATDASSGYAYISAMRITELDSIVQDFSINQSTVKPGDTISGTYAGWPDAPAATVTLTDSELNTLTLVASVTGGAGNGTWSATIPALPAAGSDVDLLKFGATTLSFSGFTAKAGPTLTVATTQTLATLASGFDSYVFQGWTPQPVAGDQLVTVTADGVFNSNGDYTFYAEGVYPVWYADGTGQVYGRTIDTSGLNEPALDTVSTPIITPESGTYSTPVTVTISTATDGATLRYTTNGTDVTSGSTLYSAPFNVAASATVKARGFKDGLSDSAQSSQTYVINTPGPVSDIDELGVWQAEYTHALRINQIIDATGINVVKVSVQQQEYIYALKVNEIITALGLPIKLLSVQQQSFMTALTINQIINALEAVVYGLKFNKSSIYGTLANRVIDVTGDIEIEFYTPDYIGTAGLSQSIVAQCAASTFTAQEFELYFSGGSGNIVVNIGGAITSVLLSGTFTASTQYRIVLSGSTSTVYNMAGGVIRTVAITRGAAREPAAAVTIGARFNGTSMVEYFGGVQRNLKINGVLWPMNARDQLVQPSTPAGNNMTLTGATLSDWVTVS